MNSDWQCQCTQINKRALHLLQNEKWSDCRFLVGIEPNQRIICGHKLILAMASPVFECMFYGQMADKSDPIQIPDVQPEAFNAMMEYIYSDQININNFDAACELCYVAKKYMLPHVVDYCTHFLWSDVNPTNACRAYEFAKLFDEPRLTQKSMALIVAFTREVITDPSFIDIETSTLMDILNQDKLNIESELDLFNAINRLASGRGIIKNTNEEDSVSIDDNAPSDDNDERMETSTAETTVPENEVKMKVNGGSEYRVSHIEEEKTANVGDGQNETATVNTSTEVVNSLDTASNTVNASNSNSTENSSKPSTKSNQIIQNKISQRPPIHEDVLREALKKIRFLTMSPQQFAEGPALSNLLQQKESLAIFIRISSSHVTDYPMPEGFSTSRVFRNFLDSQRLEHRLQRNELLNNARHGSPSTGQMNSNSLSQLGLPLTDIFYPPPGNATVPSLPGRNNHYHPPGLHHPFIPDCNSNRIFQWNAPVSLETEESRRRFGLRALDPPFDSHPITQSDRRHLRSCSASHNPILLRFL